MIYNIQLLSILYYLYNKVIENLELYVILRWNSEHRVMMMNIIRAHLCTKNEVLTATYFISLNFYVTVLKNTFC